MSSRKVEACLIPANDEEVSGLALDDSEIDISIGDGITREQRRSRRKRAVRARTISVKRMTKRELEIGRLLYPEEDYQKPKVRNVCAGGARPELPFAIAASLPLVLQSRRFSIRARIEQTAASAGIELNIAHEHDSARVIRSLYLAGAGFTFTPACSLGDGPPDDARGRWLVAR